MNAQRKYLASLLGGGTFDPRVEVDHFTDPELLPVAKVVVRRGGLPCGLDVLLEKRALPDNLIALARELAKEGEPSRVIEYANVLLGRRAPTPAPDEPSATVTEPLHTVVPDTPTTTTGPAQSTATEPDTSTLADEPNPETYAETRADNEPIDMVPEAIPGEAPGPLNAAPMTAVPQFEVARVSVDMAEAAARYAGSLGFALTPLRGKAAFLPGWNEREQCLTTPDDARDHFTAHPDQGVGLVHEYSGTCTVDIDDYRSSAAALAAVGIDLDALMAGTALKVDSGRQNRGKLVFRLPVGVSAKHCKLVWAAGDGHAGGTIFEFRAGPGCQDVLPPSIHPDTGKPYRWSPSLPETREEVPVLPPKLLDLWQRWEEYLPKMLAACPWAPAAGSRPTQAAPSGDAAHTGESIGEGVRNETLFKLGCSMRAKGAGDAAIEAALVAANRQQCHPPLGVREVESIARSVGKLPVGPSHNPAVMFPGEGPDDAGGQANSLDFEPPKPPVLQEGALYGLAGDVVRAVLPHTEADPAALLFQFLAAFGNAIGRRTCFRVEADLHYANIFVAVVGDSAVGRKGTSWSQVWAFFMDTPSYPLPSSGLSSGEGLKYHVRDPRSEKRPVKQQGRIIGYEDEVVDHGVADKRCLVVETELGGALDVMKREGNTLSAVIRAAWDSGNLRTLTKSDPITATNAHISIIGHITQTELRAKLSGNDVANGFANRFLWVSVRRSKLLPDGGSVPKETAEAIRERLGAVLWFGLAEAQGVVRDDAAAALWREVYEKLSRPHPGLHGTVTSRGPAQVVRLSLLYALLDGSDVIRVEHLRAALAAWQYAFDSAAYVFGSGTGDPIADRIENALRQEPAGMTSTEISALFGRNLPAERIAQAMALLESGGRVRREVGAPGKGRPTRRWFYAGPGEEAGAPEEVEEGGS